MIHIFRTIYNYYTDRSTALQFTCLCYYFSRLSQHQVARSSSKVQGLVVTVHTNSLVDRPCIISMVVQGDNHSKQVTVKHSYQESNGQPFIAVYMTYIACFIDQYNLLEQMWSVFFLNTVSMYSILIMIIIIIWNLNNKTNKSAIKIVSRLR